MRSLVPALITLLALLPVACVGHSVGDIERQCAKLDDPDPALRMRALRWFDDLTFWKYTSTETLRAPSLTTCLVKAARLVESSDPDEAGAAAWALRTLVQRMGPRAPETVLPIVLRAMERAQSFPDRTPPDWDSSDADVLLWLLDEVHDLYMGRPPLHYDESDEASRTESSGSPALVAVAAVPVRATVAADELVEGRAARRGVVLDDLR